MNISDSTASPTAIEPKSIRVACRILIALGLGYTAYAIRMLWLYRYTCVHADFWFMYDHLFTMPFPANILIPENSHCMVIPKLLWIANMWAFKGSETTHYIFTLLLLGIIGALLARLATMEASTSRSEQAFLIVSGLLATFWLAKLRILISAGFTVTCSLPMIGLLLGVMAVVQPGKPPAKAPNWWLGVAGCSLASFSFGTGLAIWPVMVVLVGWRNGRWREVLAVILGMIVYVILIFKVFPQWLPGEKQPHPIISPGENIVHWLMLIGSPIANTWAGLTGSKQIPPILGISAGGVGCLLAAICLYRFWAKRRVLRLPEWTGLALILFSMCAAGFIALGRTTFFRIYAQDPFSSRYLYWTTFFWLGLLWSFPRAKSDGSTRRDYLYLGLAATCLILVWPASQRLCNAVVGKRADSEYVVASLASGVPVNDLGPFLPNPAQILHLDQFLGDKRLCYYSRAAYGSVGNVLRKSFQIRPSLEQAVFDKEKSYKTLLLNKKAVKISAWILGSAADAILLVDEKQVIRGVGCFAGRWKPFSDDQRNHFMAFAPALDRGGRYRVWAVRGDECSEVVPASKTSSGQ